MSERTPLLFILLVVALGAGVFFLREPVLKPYQQMAVDLAAAQQKAAELTQQIRERGRDGRQTARLEAEYGPPMSAPDRAARATDFYRWIEALAHGCGLTVASTQLRPEQIDTDGVVKLPVQVSLDGDLRGVVAFLAQVRGSTSLIGAERLVLRRQDKADKPINAQMVVVAYALVDRQTRDELTREREAKASKRSS
ncbi:MAG: hypothetical protein HYU66_07915 [Armatimonadetes bacterium]|nr:hypothetical protein [Armatimonadota bacterium]